jgi:DNA invertase Pin-like site-specific DNA recombinase
MAVTSPRRRSARIAQRDIVFPRGRTTRLSEYDTSRIGTARREAIQALDEYQCTVSEQCRAFGISPATFHRYANGVRLRRRSVKPLIPGCRIEKTSGGGGWPTVLGMNDGVTLEKEPVMSADDALEIATVALIRSRRGFSVAEIVEALGTSKSAVYRQKAAYKERLGDLSPAQDRWFPRHLPSNLTDFLSHPEKALEAERRHRRWVHRARRYSG